MRDGTRDVRFATAQNRPTPLNIIDPCDLMATTGWVANIERRPGLHGISNSFFPVQPVFFQSSAELLTHSRVDLLSEATVSPERGSRKPGRSNAALRSGGVQVDRADDCLSPGDYRRFRSGNAENRSAETVGWFAKGRHWRAFLRAARLSSGGTTAWLGREGSNLRMAASKSA